MIFNNIREKTGLPDPALRLKAAASVIIRRNRLRIINPFLTGPADCRTKIKHTGKISVLPDKVRYFLVLLMEHLTHGKRIIFPESAVPHLSKKLPDSLRLLQHGTDAAQAILPVRLVTAERQSFFYIDNGIYPEPCQPLFQPPVHVLIDLFAETGVLPVQVRLLFVKNMQVLSVRSRQVVPHRPAKIRAPVRGQLTLCLLPEIKVPAVFPVRILTGFPEPLVLIGTVVHDKIHQKIHPTRLHLRNQPLHIFHCAKARINLIIIRDIIPLVRQRRLVARREPDNIYSQILQIVQSADNARDITDAVSIGITETLGIYLICNFIVPPLSLHINPPCRSVFYADARDEWPIRLRDSDLRLRHKFVRAACVLPSII